MHKADIAFTVRAEKLPNHVSATLLLKMNSCQFQSQQLTNQGLAEAGRVETFWLEYESRNSAIGVRLLISRSLMQMRARIQACTHESTHD